MADLVTRIKALGSAVATKLNTMTPRLLPAGGSAGQVLTKSSTQDYACAWSTPSTSGGSSGGTTTSDPFASWRRVSVVMNGNNTNTIGVLGIVAPTASGTATNRAIATTSTTGNFLRMRRLGYVSATTGGAVAGLRWTSGLFTRREGFRLTFRFGFSAINSQAQTFSVGMSSDTTANTASGGAEFVGIIGGSSYGNYFSFNATTGGGGTGPYTTLPWNSSNTDMYDLVVVALPNDLTKVTITLTNLTTGASSTTDLTSNLPDPDALLIPRALVAAGFNTTAVGIDICHIYVDTP